MLHHKKICIVTYADEKYLAKAKFTIEGVRNTGKYYGDVVLMTDGLYKVDPAYIFEMNIIIKEFPDIDVTALIEKIKAHPFNFDGREYNKTKQWNKLYSFSTYFKQWDYMMFIDAGTHIYDRISYFYSSFVENSLVAPYDGDPNQSPLSSLFQLTNTPVIERLQQICDLSARFFLNGIFIFDTSLIQENTLSELIALMNEYPVSRNNEMGIMNVYFAKKWKPMNVDLGNNMILYDYSDRYLGKKYVAVKYPIIRS